jgi:cellobiose epimerase
MNGVPDLSLSAWRFISDHLVDRQNWEWFWSVNKDLQANLKEDKAGFWKCP